MVAMNTVCVDEGAALDGNASALFKAKHPMLDADPDDGRARGLSDFDDADCVDTRPVHSCLVQGHGEAYRLSRGSKR